MQYETPPPQRFGADMPVGIIIIVLSSLLVCLGILAVAGGSILGLGGGQAMRDAGGNPAAAGVVGGAVALIGIITLAIGVINIIGATGIIKSAKWGFILTAVLNAISLVLNLVNEQKSVLGIGIAAAILLYCVLRLAGTLGPKPI